MRRRRPGAATAGLFAALALAAASGAAAGPQPPDEEMQREAVALAGSALGDMEDGNWGRAEERLRRLERLLPDNLLPAVNLAICYERLGREQEALAQIERARRLDPDNIRALYLLARIVLPRSVSDPAAARALDEVLDRMESIDPGDPRPWELRAEALATGGRPRDALEAVRQALRRSPENLALLVERLVLAAWAGDLEATGDAVDALEDRLDGFDPRLEEYAERLRDLVIEGRGDGLRPPALVVRNLLRPTDLYQVGRTELRGRGGGEGFFPQLDFDPPLPARIQGGEDIEIVFHDAGAPSGAGWRAVSIAIERTPEAERLLALEAFEAEARVRRTAAADPLEADVVAPRAPAGVPLSADVDQDGRTDLVVAAAGAGVVLLRGDAAGGYLAGETIAKLPGTAPVTALLPLEIDHDGDLDLFVGRDGAADLYLRNDGGPWREVAAELGIDGGGGRTRAAASADFDEDGDLDLVVVSADRSPRFFRNRRAGRLEDAAAAEGLAEESGAAGVEVADFDADGRFDLLLWGAGGEEGPGVRLLLRRADRAAGFARRALPPEAEALAPSAVAVADFDNDGDVDLLLAPASGEPRLLRNRRTALTLEPAGSGLPPGIRQLAAADLDADGDLDLAARLADGGVRLLRNDGGERNQWLRLSLRGLDREGGKNNTQGWYARVEARAGGSYQALVGNGGVNHLGLGARRQVEVLRVVWSNGVAQTWQQVGARQTLVEEQVLKGSCPFLYAWSGERFEFVTDLMWRSTLGMRFADGSPAPHQSARDWVLVPGEMLRPAGGELWLQLTAELWETIYVDRQSLLAVDHPEEIELVVDEAFRPPPFPREPPLHWIGRRRPPTAARDLAGRDLLPAIRDRDGIHVDDLPTGRYQGVAAEHVLELEFAPPPVAGRLRLLLWGWILPTDTSINTALRDDPARDAAPPRLEGWQADGGWRTLVESIGLPNGKRKAVVVELTEALGGLRRRPGQPLRVRIVGTMQIYWDAAALAVGEPSWPTGGPRVVRLEPAVADLHYRGFSRLYRESPSGPHLFEYETTRVEPPFPWMEGRHTRFGEVTELVRLEDDRYVVMAAGDELTLRYDADSLPPVPRGWRRDFVLYTDGWVKDADINTRHSGTVEPLPYHAMSAYPDRPAHRYPDDAEHRDYRERYQTRELDRGRFRDALRALTPQTYRPPAP